MHECMMHVPMIYDAAEILSGTDEQGNSWSWMAGATSQLRSQIVHFTWALPVCALQ